MKSSQRIRLGALLMTSALVWGCASTNASKNTTATPADAKTGQTPTPASGTTPAANPSAPGAASNEGPRPAFLTPRTDGTYVDKKGNVLVPPKVMMGVTMEQPGAALCKHLNLNPARTTLLVDIIPGLPADKAGLVDHDIVIAVDGSGDASANDIRNKLKKMKPGDKMTWTVQRGNAKETVTLTAVPWVAEHMVRPLHAGSFNTPGLSTDADRDEVPRELMPVIDRLNHIEQQLKEIQAEMKKSQSIGPR
ncbi:MAG: PDZ domain-containing protein [Planctomycetes bacterium]|nr:PDZ domain-containing protein [Planctomycetota bacterium]